MAWFISPGLDIDVSSERSTLLPVHHFSCIDHIPTSDVELPGRDLFARPIDDKERIKRKGLFFPFFDSRT